MFHFLLFFFLFFLTDVHQHTNLHELIRDTSKQVDASKPHNLVFFMIATILPYDRKVKRRGKITLPVGIGML